MREREGEKQNCCGSYPSLGSRALCCFRPVLYASLQCVEVLSKWIYLCRKVREVLLWPKSGSQALGQVVSKFPRVR